MGHHSMATQFRCCALLCALGCASGFVVTPMRPQLSAAAHSLRAADAAALPAQHTLATSQARSAVPQMGLFGLGMPELVVIGAVALFVFGPEQVKKLAKDVGKVSAELKQVPEEFNKGMEVGALEREKKNMVEAEPKSGTGSSDKAA